MPEPILGWKLTWTDYAGYVEGRTRLLKHGQKRAALPKVHSVIFPTKAACEAAQRRLQAVRSDGIVASVTPVTLPAPEPSPALLNDLPLMGKRLTP